MVGEGVLLCCLDNPEISAVLVVGRSSCGIQHPKLREVLLADFFESDEIREQLHGYDSCFFCLGVSSVGMNEADYTRTTYELTMSFAQQLASVAPDMSFAYVSGAGTDSTEKGSQMWARVKGRTENSLMKLPFKHVFAMRPGFIRARKDQRRTLRWYKYIAWLFPLLRPIFPSMFGTIEELAAAMISMHNSNRNRAVLEVRDIREAVKA